jgi:dienelactone hydrolase
MAEIVLFHHVQGLTPGVEALADDLRNAGHVVHTPDLFEGDTFDSIDDGLAFVRDLGFGTVVERGVAAVEDLPHRLVYIGISLGVLPAQALAQTRGGAAGAVLLEACVPVDEFGDAWPAGVPVQIHGMDADPSFSGEGDIDAARALVAASSSAELFLYPGDQHLFTDRSLSSHDPAAEALMLDRVLGFLESLD